MLPEPEKPSQSEQISEVTVEPAGEFVQPNILPDVSHIVKPVPTIPAVPTGVSGVELAKEVVPPLPTSPHDRAKVVKRSVNLGSTWRAVLEEKYREQQERKVA